METITHHMYAQHNMKPYHSVVPANLSFSDLERYNQYYLIFNDVTETVHNDYRHCLYVHHVKPYLMSYTLVPVN